MKFLLGILVCLILIGGGALAFVKTGRATIAASTPPDVLDRVAISAKVHAVARGAAGLNVQIPSDAAAAKRGWEHFDDNCLPCHGAPGVKAAEFAEGMNPHPPDIDGPIVQHYSDAELVWIVKNGIRATGMPGFGVNHKDEEIADLVAWVRHSPHLSPDERKAISAAAPGEHHHHGEGEEHEGGEGHEHGAAEHAAPPSPAPHHH